MGARGCVPSLLTHSPHGRALSRVGSIKVLEVDTSQGDMPLVLWWSLIAFSSEHARLKTELDAVQKLLRRLEAVKFSSVAFTARALSNDPRIRSREDDEG